MRKEMFRPIARVRRGGVDESWHSGTAAVVTPDGALVARVGDPVAARTFIRSSAKPFQALPFLRAGGKEHYDLEPADISLMCASHNGTRAHAERAEHLLLKGGFSVHQLLCGAHWPYERASRQELRAEGAEPTEAHNNCSGKHAGMLLACKMLGFPTDTYLSPDHPLQVQILETVSALCAVPIAEIAVGIDGCSMPTFHMSVAAAARGYAALADPSASGLDPETAAAINLIVESMTSVPDMVSGPGSFTTRLMEATGGRLLGKEGAEGYYTIAVRRPEPLGLALKVADGSARCRDGVVLDLLRQLDLLTPEEFAELEPFHRSVVTNWRGLEVGEIEPAVELERVG